ncbi:ABC-type dipeptide/oligopeptide/nickel transport system, permease component [Lachnospiraceae bacterium G11]|nr:ABC-type dipeptide/oligopeptide/nickel transport system, permease component [Lachnospiraceae bacterium G11]
MEDNKELLKKNLQEQDEFEKNQVIMTPGQLVAKRFFRNKLACIGVAIIAVMALFCIIGPFLTPYGEYEIFYKDMATGEEHRMQEELDMSQMGINVKAPISEAHWLGTDTDGRDVFTRLMYGGRISLTVGFVVVIIELILGIFLGGLAGYYGGAVDMVIMRLVEVFYSLPFIPIMLILSSLFVGYNISPQYKIYFIMIVMGILDWAGVARNVRAQILSLREMEYMQAAESTGIKTTRKIFKHLVPNTMPIIILIATMDVGSVILYESVLSYLGVGIAWPYASWGNMANTVADSIILKNYPNIWAPPGILILLTVLAFNFIGDGMRDAFDPRMKR